MGMKKKVYISGPMTDSKTGRVTDENIMAFVRAYALLKKEKYVSESIGGSDMITGLEPSSRIFCIRLMNFSLKVSRMVLG